MFYYLYKITNNVNGKIYVGYHKTSNIDDGYMGSGKIIKHAIKKHGLDNFTKVILEYFENAEAMYAREKEIVDDDFLARPDVYNLRRGGNGGFDHINKNRTAEEWSRLGKLRRAKSKGNTGKIFSVEWKANISKSLKGSDNSAAVEAARSKKSNHKRKLTMRKRKHQQGENNSNFGKIWITDGIKAVKIRKDQIHEYLERGYMLGRTIKIPKIKHITKAELYNDIQPKCRNPKCNNSLSLMQFVKNIKSCCKACANSTRYSGIV